MDAAQFALKCCRTLDAWEGCYTDGHHESFRPMMGLIRSLAIVALLVMSTALSHAKYEAQRTMFLSAYGDISAGRSPDWDMLAADLGDYPLLPYLRYYHLRMRLANADVAQVDAFLREHRDLPVIRPLMHAWLRELGRREDWDDFLSFYQPSASAELNCYRLQAEAARGVVGEEWWARARELWLVGASQPRACDPVFARLYAADALSPEQRWQRVALAMEARNIDLARYLGRYLSEDDRVWLEHWLTAERRPASVLRTPQFDPLHPRGATILAHALRRLAAISPRQAWTLLPKVRNYGAWSASKVATLSREVALAAAYRRLDPALSWLDALPESAVDDEVLHWRAILARGAQDWPRLLRAIADLPETQSARAEWRYWNAYAHERMGFRVHAHELYDELSRERSYYGFLAADALNRPYHMNAASMQFAPEEVAEIQALPAVTRALELFKAGLLVDARREWRSATASMDAVALGRAAAAAAAAGWYDRAIVTANRAGLYDALNLRFPMGYRESVEHYSGQHELDTAFTFALMRKESAFRPDAVSSAGALGLMQVMPATGRSVARRLELNPPSRDALLDVDTNLHLGSAYLRSVLDRFDGNPVLAAAAYNAGPHRVDRWLERNAHQPAELWIENISFRETRGYVKDVLAFSTVFEWQMNGGTPSRLSERMGKSGGWLTVCVQQTGDC